IGSKAAIMHLLLLLVSLASVGTASSDRLLSVNIVIRHGDRAATQGWATPQSERKLFRGHDELTDSGIDHVFRQGQDFQKRYVRTGFINKKFLPHEVSVRSSSVNRCLMSAASFTRALFFTTSKGNAVIPPIHSNDAEFDWLVYPHLECSDGWSDVISRFNLTATNGFAGAAAEALLQTDWDCPEVPPALFDAVVSEEPNELIHMKPSYKTCAVSKGRSFMFKYIELLAGAGDSFNELRLKRNAGMLTQQLLKNFAKAAECSSTDTCKEPKLRVYYTHDVMTLALAHIFGILDRFEKINPAFSSALVFETRRKENGDVYVKIIQKDGENALFKDTRNCATDCSLSAVTQGAAPFAITEKIPCATD
ncbi:hypothetical protein PENTCL1PPCAC_28958, partial [Pristionchus entomophagus]